MKWESAGEGEFTVEEAQRALHVARRIPAKVLVAHLGVPRAQSSSPGDNSRDGARRSVEELRRLAAPLDVHVAVEVIPNELSRAASLVHFVEEDLEALDVGVCLDFGHAHMDGDLIDAIETVSGHLLSTHLHDNADVRERLHELGLLTSSAVRIEFPPATLPG